MINDSRKKFLTTYFFFFFFYIFLNIILRFWATKFGFTRNTFCLGFLLYFFIFLFFLYIMRLQLMFTRKTYKNITDISNLYPQWITIKVAYIN